MHTVRFVVNANHLRALDKLNSDSFDPRFIIEGNLIHLQILGGSETVSPSSP